HRHLDPAPGRRQRDPAAPSFLTARVADRPRRGDRPVAADDAIRVAAYHGGRGRAARDRVPPPAAPYRGRAAPVRPAGAARPGGGAPAPRARPPRRGQPGADRDPPAPRGAEPGRTRLAEPGDSRPQGDRELGHGGAPSARPPAAPRVAG